MIPAIAVTAPVGPEGAPLLVLGPSLGTSTILWEDAAPALAARWRVAAWDLPGHGASPPADRAVHRRRSWRMPWHGRSAELGGGPALYAGVSLGGADRPGAVPPASASSSARPRSWHPARSSASPQRGRERAAQVRAQSTSLAHHRVGGPLVRARARSRDGPSSPAACCTRCARPTTRATRSAARRSPPTTCATGSARSPRRCSPPGASSTPSRPRRSRPRSPPACATADCVRIADAAHLPPAEQPDARRRRARRRSSPRSNEGAQDATTTG